MKKINIDLEKIYVTPGVRELVDRDLVNNILLGNILHDFNECKFHNSMDTDDIKLNMKAVEEQCGRVVAPYVLDGTTIWIIHYFGADGYTTILLPSEY